MQAGDYSGTDGENNNNILPLPRLVYSIPEMASPWFAKLKHI